eukprot:scaffold192860_cov37-Tisochrysis_lutea.AAC.6
MRWEYSRSTFVKWTVEAHLPIRSTSILVDSSHIHGMYAAVLRAAALRRCSTGHRGAIERKMSVGRVMHVRNL